MCLPKIHPNFVEEPKNFETQYLNYMTPETGYFQLEVKPTEAHFMISPNKMNAF
jgi:hypothetical protein